MDGASHGQLVVTIGGSDPSGGAGVQADLRVFALHSLFATAVITALTVQNSGGVRRVDSVAGDLVSEQLRAILGENRVAAMKTGMLGSAAAVAAVADVVEELAAPVPLVVDPVMVSSSGRPLLEDVGVAALRERLLPLATVITPNLDEAAVLLKRDRIAPGGASEAARLLATEFGACVVVKGGHEPGNSAVDHVCFAATGADEDGDSFRLEAPWINTPDTHGTGCLFSAALCASLAHGNGLRSALEHARRCMDRGLWNARPGAAGPGNVWLDRLPEKP